MLQPNILFDQTAGASRTPTYAPALAFSSSVTFEGLGVLRVITRPPSRRDALALDVDRTHPVLLRRNSSRC